MAQPFVKLVSTNEQDYTITLLINSDRVEFSVKPDCWVNALRQLKNSLQEGWFNKAITDLFTKSDTSENLEGRKMYGTLNWKKGNSMSRNVPKPSDYCKTPGAEYLFTLIAPEAQSGLVYQGERIWHKTEDAAVEYAKVIYSANKEQQFSLVVVKATQEIAPKPQIELTSKAFT